MLPHLSTLAGELQSFVDREISRRVHVYMGALGAIPKHYVHEGSEMFVDRADGTSETNCFSTASAEVAIDARRTPSFTDEDANEFIDALAKEMAGKITVQLYRHLDSVLESAGQTVHVQGEFGPQAVFDLLEKMELNFAPDGTIEQIFTSLGSEVRARFNDALRQIESSPELSAAMEALMERKKEAFNDREASRKLVG